jgi:hypothetical protein
MEEQEGAGCSTRRSLLGIRETSFGSQHLSRCEYAKKRTVFSPNSLQVFSVYRLRREVLPAPLEPKKINFKSAEADVRSVGGVPGAEAAI